MRTAATFALFAFSLQAASLPPVLAPAGGFADMVARNVPSVVRIMTTKVDAPWANGAVNAAYSAQAKPGPRTKTVSGEGSGVVVSADGYLVTNHHVVEHAVRIIVEFHDDRALPATLVAADPATDLAVLKVDAQNLQPIAFGDSRKLRVGEVVLAIGNPFGVGTTVTSGIVSALSSSHDEDYIQTDAAINPGNSGGALLNAAGELVGINTAIVSPSGGSSGIGFALPSNVARRVMTELRELGRVRRGYLGVGLQPITPNLTEALNLSRPGGAIVTDVTPGSPADQAGLRKGDVVLGMNGRPIRDFDRLRLLIATAQPGASVQLALSRDGELKTLAATLIERPATGQPESAGAPSAGDLLSGAVLAEIDDHTRQELGLPAELHGILVTAIDPNGDSAEAGLKTGDIIVVANRQPVRDVSGLHQATAASRLALLEINRQGATFFLAVPRV